jgi:hypothetical protein
MSGHLVNKHGIPERCPHCGIEPPEGSDVIAVRVENHSLMWHDGDVVCAVCGGFIRRFDAG